MKNLKLILKGFIVGIGKIIPGVSGSILAIQLGIYDKALNAISHLFNKKNIIFLFFFCIGVGISIIFFSNIILYFLTNYYLYTMLLFSGLIVGGIPAVKKEVKFNKRNTIIFLLTFILIVLSSIFSYGGDISRENNSIFIYVLSGFLDSAATVVPGISGTSILMILGTYNQVITSISSLFDFSILIENLRVMLPFAIGFGIGLLIISKILDYLFKHHKSATYSSIFAILLSTTILMFIKSFSKGYDLNSLIIGILFFIFGLFFSILFKKIGK